MLDDTRQLLKRWCDLDRIANNKYMVCYTDFLNATEYSIFLEHQHEFQCQTYIYQGIDQLERQMVAFIPEALPFNNQDFPICILKIFARNKRFAQELTHRDILGSLMSLSIERKLIGDIFFQDGNCYVLVHKRISQLIQDELHRIKHTEILIEECSNDNLSIQRSYQECAGTIASIRLDCILSEFTNSSRSQSLQRIQDGLVFINNKQTFTNAAPCKEGDIISIRHVGKYQIIEFNGISKKGKVKIRYNKYI